jgi:hypothetical protein
VDPCGDEDHAPAEGVAAGDHLRCQREVQVVCEGACERSQHYLAKDREQVAAERLREAGGQAAATPHKVNRLDAFEDNPDDQLEPPCDPQRNHDD